MWRCLPVALLPLLAGQLMHRRPVQPRGQWRHGHPVAPFAPPPIRRAPGCPGQAAFRQQPVQSLTAGHRACRLGQHCGTRCPIQPGKSARYAAARIVLRCCHPLVLAAPAWLAIFRPAGGNWLVLRAASMIRLCSLFAAGVAATVNVNFSVASCGMQLSSHTSQLALASTGIWLPMACAAGTDSVVSRTTWSE